MAISLYMYLCLDLWNYFTLYEEISAQCSKLDSKLDSELDSELNC